METVFKLVLSVALGWIAIASVLGIYGIWISHIDPKATIHRVFSLKGQPFSWVVKREPDKIYQSGQPVGDVQGKTRRDGTEFVFETLFVGEGFDQSRPFEFGRMQLRMIESHSTGIIGMYLPGRTVLQQSELRDVKCEVLKGY